MLIAILLVFTPLILFALFDLLTNGSTGTISGLQELATRPGDALMALLIFALVGSVYASRDNMQPHPIHPKYDKIKAWAWKQEFITHTMLQIEFNLRYQVRKPQRKS